MAHIQLLKRLHDSMCLKPKPKQIRRWEELLHGNDVIGVFPAEFKKSFAVQLLPVHFIDSLSWLHQYRVGSVSSQSNHRRIHSTVETDWKREILR